MIEGAVDVHVHAAPSLFARWGDAWDLAEAVRDAGMAGFVLKSHRTSTVEVAALLSRAFPTLRVHGGIALNRFVGGLGPVAVDAANPYVLVVAHVTALAVLWWWALRLDLADHDAVVRFYMRVWALFFAEYLIVPAAVLTG